MYRILIIIPIMYTLFIIIGGARRHLETLTKYSTKMDARSWQAQFGKDYARTIKIAYPIKSIKKLIRKGK